MGLKHDGRFLMGIDERHSRSYISETVKEEDDNAVVAWPQYMTTIQYMNFLYRAFLSSYLILPGWCSYNLTTLF